MSHSLSLRVYYEDTDLAGIVYYANYLKFIERARTEWVRELGIDQRRLKAEDDIVFAVRRVEADYLAPALFDDSLTIVTRPIGSTAARVLLQQSVIRDDQTLFEAVITLVALSSSGRAVRLPADVRQKFERSDG